MCSRVHEITEEEEDILHMYNKLQLKLVDGNVAAIAVEPAFRAGELVYHPRKRAVSLGNLTVLYEGMVYEVTPSQQGDHQEITG